MQRTRQPLPKSPQVGNRLDIMIQNTGVTLQTEVLAIVDEANSVYKLEAENGSIYDQVTVTDIHRDWDGSDLFWSGSVSKGDIVIGPIVD